MSGQMEGGSSSDSCWKVLAAHQRGSIQMVRDQGIGMIVPQTDRHSLPSSALSCLGLPTLSASPSLKETTGLSLGSPFSYHGLETL